MRLTRLLTALLLVSTSSLFGQGVPPAGSGATDTYGTSSLTWLTLSAWDFHPLGTPDTYDWTNRVGTIAIGIYNTGTGLMGAPLHFPEGALVSSFEFQACDYSNGGEIAFYLDTVPKIGMGYTESFLTTTGGAAVPMCSLFAFTLPTPITIDNANNSYFLQPQFTTTGTSLVLQSARIGYKLQISPDPAGATFADVPHGHPFHRFVEALVAAGITGGCGGGNYCPDAPVTRGQMAVFLSAALGLHWAP
jgi:hypothetical protein